MKIRDPQQFLKVNFSGKCILLDDLCLSREWVEYMKLQVNEMLMQDGFIDLDSVLPAAIDDEDLELLLRDY